MPVLTASAQDASWEIQVAAPAGYTDTGDASRRVFIKRQKDERHRVEISIQRHASDSLEAFLKSQALSRETAVEGSMKPVMIASRQGLRLAFEGTFEFQSKTFRSSRQVAAVRLSEISFLKISSRLVYAGEAPSEELRQSAQLTVKELTEGLKVSGGPSGGAPEAGKNEQEPVVTSLSELYRSDTIVPFSFRFPAGWYVGDDSNQAQGSLWVIATPFAEQAPYVPLGSLEAALRVNVIGYLPELLDADDKLECAVQLTRQTYMNPSNGSALDPDYEKRTMLGSAPGRLLRYGPKDKSSGPAGLVLVIAIDTSVIVADFSWPNEMSSSYERQALQILNSFKIDIDLALKPIESDDVRFSYPEKLWSMTEVGTQDRSRAWLLKRNETELFLRSLPLREGQTISAKALEKTCRMLVSRELGLAEEDRAKDSSIPVIPGSKASWRCLLLRNGQISDCFAMVRDGAFHFAVLTSRRGIRGFDHAQALEIFNSLRGTRPTPAEPVVKKSSLAQDLRLTTANARHFDSGGGYIGPARKTLHLKTDGSALFVQGEPGEPPLSGAYTVTDGVIRVACGPRTFILKQGPTASHFLGADQSLWRIHSGL